MRIVVLDSAPQTVLRSNDNRIIHEYNELDKQLVYNHKRAESDPPQAGHFPRAQWIYTQNLSPFCCFWVYKTVGDATAQYTEYCRHILEFLDRSAAHRFDEGD